MKRKISSIFEYKQNWVRCWHCDYLKDVLYSHAGLFGSELALYLHFFAHSSATHKNVDVGACSHGSEHTHPCTHAHMGSSTRTHAHTHIWEREKVKEKSYNLLIPGEGYPKTFYLHYFSPPIEQNSPGA